MLEKQTGREYCIPPELSDLPANASSFDLGTAVWGGDPIPHSLFHVRIYHKIVASV